MMFRSWIYIGQWSSKLFCGDWEQPLENYLLTTSLEQVFTLDNSIIASLAGKKHEELEEMLEDTNKKSASE